MIGRFLRNRPHSLELAYRAFERVFLWFAPLMKKIGLKRVEKLILWPERVMKELVFDCRMCGQCVLHYTGMTCSMTCPKTLRNGPCGGVRQNGHCEVKPEMMCIWVEAFERSEKMTLYGHEMMRINPVMNHKLKNTSSWVNLVSGADQELPAGWRAHD